MGIKLSKNWQEEIREEWNIRPLIELSCNALWTSRCAPTKPVKIGFPSEMYESPLLTKFYAFVEEHAVRYGIVSDMYGLHLDVERLPFYDIHPSLLDEAQKIELGAAIGNKATAAGFSSLVFYNGSPIRSVPYFKMLSNSGLDVFYTTRLEWKP